MRLSPKNLVVVALIGLAFAVGLACNPALWSRPRSAGDSWRRTAQGWERGGDWESSLPWTPRKQDAGATLGNPDMVRLDMHPAALALGQLTAVLASLAYFSGRNRVQASPFADVPALIARSFRASFFGC